MRNKMYLNSMEVENYKDMTNKVINKINSVIDYSRESDFSTEQVNAMNTGNIVTILGVIAQTLAVIADKLEEG